MSKEIILMLHPTFGILGVLAAVWVFVDTLNINEGNLKRIRLVSFTAAVFIWLSFVFGGYWYVEFYASDKAIIKAGPWPMAHSLVMETKEHLFFSLLLAGTYLPIAAASRQLLKDRGAHYLVMITAVLIVLLGLFMEATGATVALGVKVGLLGGSS
jgi:predicted membrane channel-forming protein YqfA (hemolysin III family)